MKHPALFLLSATLLSLPPARAQTARPVIQAPTDEEQRACDKEDLTRRCTALATEFHLNHLLSRPTPTALNLEPFADTKAFSESLHKYALLALLDEAKTSAQQKLAQTISTAAAVNQTGGSATSAGSTNLAAKPTTTDFLSLAAESGAFTDTVNGTGTTLQANANGLAKYLSNQPVFAVDHHNWSSAFRPLTLGVTLNLAQSSTATPVATSGSATTNPLALASVLIPSNNASFSSFQASYMFYRPFSPTSQKTQATLAKAIDTNQAALNKSAAAIAAALNTLEPTFRDSPDILTARETWLAAGHLAEQQNDFAALVHAYAVYDKAYLEALTKAPGFNKTALTLESALRAYDATVDTVMSAVRGTALATATYAYATPTSQPANHQFTLVASYLFKGGKATDTPAKPTRTFFSGAQFTGNFTGSLYASLPANATYGRFRDIQLSTEFDKPFAGTTAAPRATFSIAGYGQYQYSPTVLNITSGNLAPGTNITLPSNAQVLLGTAGWIGVVQGKLVINLKPGLSLPVAIKWSNKTDLLPTSDVRGQIGLSYDLSALSQLIAPK